MLDVLGKDCLEVTAAEDEHPLEALAPFGADHALAEGVRPRGLTGVLTTLAPSAAKTASKEAVNLASRSRMRNVTAFA